MLRGHPGQTATTARPASPFRLRAAGSGRRGLNPTFGGTEDDLGSGELAPGGTASGDVCFEGGAEPGQYALIYEATFSSDRAVWVNNR